MFDPLLTNLNSNSEQTQDRVETYESSKTENDPTIVHLVEVTEMQFTKPHYKLNEEEAADICYRAAFQLIQIMERLVNDTLKPAVAAFEILDDGVAKIRKDHQPRVSSHIVSHL